MITLILGGARSGKSRYAEQMASAGRQPVLYIATATASDAEMAARITHHRQQRPAHWQTRECPLALADALRDEAARSQTILVDCLTLWLNNHLFQNPSADIPTLGAELADACCQAQADIILVANEVGLGVVPLGEVSRRFVDEAGRLNQQLAQLADRVVFIAAGLPLVLKDHAT